jgi:hypothetical protein
MNKKAIFALVLIAGGVIWGGFYLLRGGEKEMATPVPALGSFGIEKITADHFYTDGTHRIEGRISLPTPCHTLAYEARIAESYPEQVTIDFRITTGTGVCAQVLSDKLFGVSFKASPDAKISARINDVPVVFDLIDQTGAVKGSSIEKL